MEWYVIEKLFSKEKIENYTLGLRSGRHKDAYKVDLPIMSNVHRNRIDIIVAIS